MILIDSPVKGWCHLVSDNIQELHIFAQKIGIKRCWFQNKGNKYQPHYDLRESKIPIALNNGAIQISRKELFNFLKQHFKKST